MLKKDENNIAYCILHTLNIKRTLESFRIHMDTRILHAYVLFPVKAIIDLVVTCKVEGFTTDLYVSSNLL